MLMAGATAALRGNKILLVTLPKLRHFVTAALADGDSSLLIWPQFILKGERDVQANTHTHKGTKQTNKPESWLRLPWRKLDVLLTSLALTFHKV